MRRVTEVLLLPTVAAGARPQGSHTHSHTHLVGGDGAQSLEDRGDVVFTGVRHVYSSASDTE